MKTRSRSAFTLIELLVVISIIALLIGILLPALAAARESGRQSQCLSNVRQLGISLYAYATDNEGKFPPNDSAAGSPAGSEEWHDLARLGRYMPEAIAVGGTANPNNSIGGGIMVCPSDLPNAGRCYGMNIFASSAQRTGATPLTLSGGQRFVYFDVAVPDASKMILVGENYSQNAAGLWYSPASIGGGAPGPTAAGYPAVFFGANGGQNRSLPTTRWPDGSAVSSIDWTRHGKTRPNQFAGRASFSFADGHAATVSATDTVTSASGGVSTLQAMWSPTDKLVTP